MPQQSGCKSVSLSAARWGSPVVPNLFIIETTARVSSRGSAGCDTVAAGQRPLLPGAAPDAQESVCTRRPWLWLALGNEQCPVHKDMPALLIVSIVRLPSGKSMSCPAQSRAAHFEAAGAWAHGGAGVLTCALRRYCIHTFIACCLAPCLHAGRRRCPTRCACHPAVSGAVGRRGGHHRFLAHPAHHVVSSRPVPALLLGCYCFGFTCLLGPAAEAG